jgi:hypothetical protein
MVTGTLGGLRSLYNFEPTRTNEPACRTSRCGRVVHHRAFASAFRRHVRIAPVMKYMVLKIAAGVFLGVIASLAAYKAFQIWEANSVAESHAKQQRLEAEALKTRIAKAAENLDYVLPERLVALCGPPLRDHTTGGRRHMELSAPTATGFSSNLPTVKTLTFGLA